jgi:uncharacterized BrkB/YihY/UPF0761 family membrane protein
VLLFVFSAVIYYHLCSNAYASRLVPVLSNLLPALKIIIIISSEIGSIRQQRGGSTRLVGSNIGWGVIAVLDTSL